MEYNSPASGTFNSLLSGTYTDLYQLSMAQVYYLSGREKEQAVFDYYFRELPFKGGYAVFAGLSDVLEVLFNLRFTSTEIDFLRSQGFHDDFLRYLETFRFSGSLYSATEGDVIFPLRPILRVEASIIEAQIVETVILNLLNFQTLVATKASRMRLAAGDRMLADFGLRRAQATAGYYASKAAFIGGVGATSNVYAGMQYNIPVSGTMAHSFVQSCDDELSAFRSFAEGRPDNCMLLVDTYDTLNSGVPNAITVAKEMEARGQQLLGIRLDSGDLAYLSTKARALLNEAGLHYVKIAASNQLDEHLINSLLQQEAPIDLFGVGTKLVTGYPDGALDGVYKLAYTNGQPRIKISETMAKVTLPHRKQVLRIIDKEGGFFGADVVTMVDEQNPQVMYHPYEPGKSLDIGGYSKEPQLHKVMENGEPVQYNLDLEAILAYSIARLAMLPREFKRFEFPHRYKVGLSQPLKDARDKMVAIHKSS